MNPPLLAYLLAAFAALHAAPAKEKPNIVFIIADDLGWADLGCYGSTFYETPNLDRLANQGMRFTDAYAAAPVCSPTRASILTGKHPARLRITDWLPGRKDKPEQRLRRLEIQPFLPLEEFTLAEAFKAGGYKTVGQPFQCQQRQSAVRIFGVADAGFRSRHEPGVYRCNPKKTVARHAKRQM